MDRSIPSDRTDTGTEETGNTNPTRGLPMFLAVLRSAPKGQPQISPGQRPGTGSTNRDRALKGPNKAVILCRPFRACGTSASRFPGRCPRRSPRICVKMGNINVIGNNITV